MKLSEGLRQTRETAIQRVRHLAKNHGIHEYAGGKFLPQHRIESIICAAFEGAIEWAEEMESEAETNSTVLMLEIEEAERETE